MRDEQPEWVIAMTVSAWRAAQELDAHCERCGLDAYAQAEICLAAAIGTPGEALWSQVWDYIQTIEGKGRDERLLVMLEADGDAGHA